MGWCSYPVVATPTARPARNAGAATFEPRKSRSVNGGSSARACNPMIASLNPTPSSPPGPNLPARNFRPPSLPVLSTLLGPLMFRIGWDRVQQRQGQLLVVCGTPSWPAALDMYLCLRRAIDASSIKDLFHRQDLKAWMATHSGGTRRARSGSLGQPRRSGGSRATRANGSRWGSDPPLHRPTDVKSYVIERDGRSS